MDLKNTTRRSLLSKIGLMTSVGITGCIGGTGSENGREISKNIRDHPISKNADKWPHLGSDIFETDITLIVLDDPSCPRCASFHKNTFPKIRSNLIEKDKGSFVSRPYPVVYQWGMPAAHALEAVYDRNEESFWKLADFYFKEQSGFSIDNVHQNTEIWLDENTDLNGRSVIQDVKSEVYSDRIQATINAANSVNAGKTTPVIFMFKDGIFQTKATGSISYTAIESTLDL